MHRQVLGKCKINNVTLGDVGSYVRRVGTEPDQMRLMPAMQEDLMIVKHRCINLLMRQLV
jgi:hypothetical protein